LNLNVVTKMSPMLKNLIGLGLIALIALGLFLGYRAITKSQNNNKVKKNKDKKKN